jgi:sulfur transfer complex TusBCD TusB component (DsrH family)
MRCWLVIALVAGTMTGCGNTLYAVQASSASSKLEEARELGAEQYAPYEYFYAREHLQKAQTEASEADYSDAIDLAETSEEYAEKAIRLTREAHRGAGR